MPDEPAPLPLSEQSTVGPVASPVHRQVGLKVIEAGMGSAHVVARFEAERQVLALMDHPVPSRRNLFPACCPL